MNPSEYDNPTNGKCEHCGQTGDCVVCGHVDDRLAPVIAEIYRQAVCLVVGIKIGIEMEKP
jgi:hypothetical protein